jgi:hypothetical protein
MFGGFTSENIGKISVPFIFLHRRHSPTRTITVITRPALLRKYTGTLPVSESSATGRYRVPGTCSSDRYCLRIYMWWPDCEILVICSPRRGREISPTSALGKLQVQFVVHRPTTSAFETGVV